jgi:tetratricopeptide (TPR) repeat protein
MQSIYMKYAYLFFFTLVLCLRAVAQESPSSTIQLCDQIADDQLKITCEQFHQALVEKKLLKPAGASAYELYTKLERADPLPGLVLSLRIKLTAALQQEVSQALEVASRLPMDQTTLALIYERDFADFQVYLDKLTALPGREGDQPKDLKWQQMYFSGLELRDKARRVESRDSSLLIPAVKTFLSALELSPEQALIHQEIGEVLLDAKSYNQSKTFLMQANAAAPDWARPVIGLSQFLSALNEEESALAMAERAVSAQTDFAQSYLNAARLFAHFERPEKSMEYYRLAIDKLMADIVSGPEAFKWLSAYRLAELFMQFELYEEAEKLLREVIAKREAPGAYLLLGEIYESSNRTLAADSVYRRTIALWPDHIGAYLRGGLLYQNIGRYALAEPFFEKAYSLNPKHREACFNLGALRHLYNQSGEAELLYRQALAYPQGFQQVHNKVDETLKKMDEDRGATYRKLLSAMEDPETFFQSNFAFAGPPVSASEDFIYANLGDLYFAQGRTDEAIDMYRNALLLNPGLPEVYKSLIQCYYDKEAFQQALTYIQLYTTYVPYTRDTKEDWKVMGKTTRELLQKGAERLSDEELNVYFFFMDNFWPYLYEHNRETKEMNLERTILLRQQRPILQAIRKTRLEDYLR